MEKYQLDFYLKLSPTEQLILKTAALKSSFNSVSQIADILMYRQKLTQKTISACLDEGIRYKLFVNTNSGYNRGSFKVSVPFLIYILPELTDFNREYSIVNKHSDYFYYTDSLIYLREFLYSLLFNKKEFGTAQTKLLHLQSIPDLSEIAQILDYPVYDSVISLIKFDFLQIILTQKVNDLISSLQPISEIVRIVESVKLLVGPENASHIIDSELIVSQYEGKFEKLTLVKYNHENYFYFVAVEALTKRNTKVALTNFDKAIKLERANYKNLQLPRNPFYTIYYLTTLLCIDPETAAVQFQKILKGLERNSYSSFDSFYKATIYNALNGRVNLKAIVDSMLAYIKQEHNDLQSLLYVCICYQADAKPNSSLQHAVEELVRKAFKNGYFILAYETSFVLNKWFKSSESESLFAAIAQKMSYEPVLSQISRQEEWEKSLNVLFSLGLDKNSASAKNKEGKTRVVYYFSPNSHEIRPVLQTRTTKGEWTGGRNISMKTFFDAKTAGMTEQDFRVAKSIKRYNNYYDGDVYDFTQQSIIELIGHPYIFLDKTADILVEFVAAQPEIKVTKSAKGYSLTCDIKSLTNETLIVKETNTRYKIYDLSSQQKLIINTLAIQQVMVPEQGKDKLVQLLGGFSKHMTIHSDIVATQTERSSMDEVTSDNRIRVQLLPFGDGLKAELYSKPFGNRPPYCKPGVGGKVLIANENGMQLQVKRNLKQEEEYANVLLSDIQSLESMLMTDELIAFENPLDSLNLLDILAAHKEISVIEWPEGERFKIRGTANFSNLNLRIKSKTNWFELEGELKVNEDTVLTIQQLMALMTKNHDRFIELDNGGFLALSSEMKKRLDELYAFTTSSKDGLHINKFASIALGDFFDDVEQLKTDKAWKEFRQRIETADVEDAKLPAMLQAELRPYQEEGFRWMARLAEWEGGACLADDMGLGKTIQTLAILLHRSTVGAALVVCPVSVVGNWIAEIQRFAPTLNVKTLGATNRELTLNSLEAGDLLITSYGLLQSEEKLFAQKSFATVVLDEAHIVKNFATKTSKATMQLKASFRVALTGTPLQNHLGEIWNLFNFVNPGLLGNMQQFNDNFVKPENDFARKQLRKLIAPFILRRTKSAVLDELPPKTEIVKKIQLSDEEMAFYEALRRQAILNIESGEGNQGTKHLQVLAEITKLRQASCNPLLVDANVNIPSSKLATFLEIVDELIENKHRALVFSQFVSHLSIVREALDKKGINYQYLDGSMPIPERERNLKKFQSGEGELFLISLKAGGLGLNLTAADYVIHMDPWWNPAIEDQASDRAHRMGQTRPVTIYRLVAEKTIEEKIILLHNTKRDLAESLLEGSDQSARMSLNELVGLIQEGL